MISREDKVWQTLLERSKPVLEEIPGPPYGFVTNTLAKLREQRSQKTMVEKICLSALLASICGLLVASALTLTLQWEDRDVEPGVRSMALSEAVAAS